MLAKCKTEQALSQHANEGIQISDVQLQKVVQRRVDAPKFAVNAQQSEQMVPSAPSRQRPGIGSAATAAAPAAAVPVGGWNVLQVIVHRRKRACFRLLSSVILV